MGTGYPIAAEAFDFELFQLACIFAASRELSLMSQGHPGIARLKQVFELSEAARRLLSIAAMVRSALDTWAPTERTALDDQVGELIPDKSRPTEKEALKFREACNKIIHADDTDLSESSGSMPGALTYSVVMLGQKGTQEWQAHLDVLSFIEVASRVA